MKNRYLTLVKSAGRDVADAVFSHVSLANRQLWLMACKQFKNPVGQ